MKTISTQARHNETIQARAISDPATSAPKGLRDLFEEELKDIYWVEKSLIRMFSKMIINAQSPELINAISEHLETTIGHVARLEKVFSIVGTPAVQKKCEAIERLIRETTEIIATTEEGIVRDAGIITAAQKVEHYEIASYSTLCAFAETLGESEAAILLRQTLSEEKEAEVVLTSIARSSMSVEANDYEYFSYRSTKRKTA